MKISEIEPRLLRVAEAAAIANVCKSRAYEYAASGVWPVVKLGKSVRIPRRGLEAWLRRLEDEAGVDGEGK